MKVALFVHCFFPDHFYGTETYTLELARNLMALGHQVTVVSAVFQGEPPRETLVSRYVHDGVPVIVIDKNKLPHRNIRETYWQEEMRRSLRQILRELECDVVHVTHLVNHTAVLLEEAKALGLPVVATLTDFFGFCYTNKLESADGALCAGPNRLRTNCLACHIKAAGASAPGTPMQRIAARPWLLRAAAVGIRTAYAAHVMPWSTSHAMAADIVDRPDILFKAYRHYDAMIAPTTFLRDAYVRNRFDPTRLHLSRFGVDIDRSPKRARAEGQPLVIGFIGQLAPHKGVDLLLKAAAKLPAHSLRIKIYGPETQDPAYMTQLRELAGPHTEFLGTFPPDRMASLMATFDVLAIPSTWYENSPLVLLYALATHTPVLVSDVQGLMEFIDDGQTGWSFRRGDLADLTAVLGRLVGNPHAVRAAGARTAYDRDIRAMTKDVVDVYHQVIEKHSRERAANLDSGTGPTAHRHMNVKRFRDGIRGDFDAWLEFNLDGAFESPESLEYVAPFPPRELMQNVSGLVDPRDFAKHGCDILRALHEASPTALSEYTDILDFGVGVGRLARMFKGTRGRYTGVDVDQRHIAWVSSALDYVSGVATVPHQPLPFADKRFDCVIAISVFTHMNEQDQFLYLAEIARVARPGAMVFLTVHGERALQRAETETSILKMLSVPRNTIERTRHLFATPGFNFIQQKSGPVTSEAYEYGITFTGKDYVAREWSKYFDVVQICPGAIHDFQDIVVLKAR
ncbi:MAG: glycosyltransferase [Rhodospirillaceae bacterium]|nr:MAG: glycosyltransferase [Rhodospirillaceae bacterium]